MISIIPTTNGISIESRIPVTQEFINKIENPENKQKIHAHLKDMKCQHKLEEDESGTPISVLHITELDQMSDEKFNTLIKVMKANHEAFLENVNLRMKETIDFSKDEVNSDEADKKLQSATEMLKAIDEIDDDDPIVFGGAIAIFLDIIGHIRCGFLKEILDTYIDKHLAHESNK